MPYLAQRERNGRTLYTHVHSKKIEATQKSDTPTAYGLAQLIKKEGLYLHKSMIYGGHPSRWPFQKIVEFGLKLTVPNITTVLLQVEGFAQKTHSWL